MLHAEVTKTVDLGYKSGYVECACGWKKELGDGFNGYHVANCPACTEGLTFNQRKVTYFDKRRGMLRADVGQNVYFILSNGIHIRFRTGLITSHWGTERQLRNK